jgi:hypothetical protein
MSALLYQDDEYPPRNYEERAGSAASRVGQAAARTRKDKERRCQ